MHCAFGPVAAGPDLSGHHSLFSVPRLWGAFVHGFFCNENAEFTESLVCSLFNIWIQEGFTAEPPRHDSGADFQANDSGFGPKVGVTARKSELQAKSRSYSGADPQSPNRLAQKRNPNRVWVLLQKTPP